MAVSAGLLLLVLLVWGRAVVPLPSPLFAFAWAVQTTAAIVLFTAVLGESMPGRLSSRGRLAATALLGVTVVIATMLAFVWFAPFVPPWLGQRITRICLSRAFGLGLVPLMIAAMLSMQGLASRPVVAGALAGLGSGLLAESNWRVYCGVTELGHSLVGHVGATVLLTATGGLAGAVFRRLRT